jgi:hypothetical protein
MPSHRWVREAVWMLHSLTEAYSTVPSHRWVREAVWMLHTLTESYSTMPSHRWVREAVWMLHTLTEAYSTMPSHRWVREAVWMLHTLTEACSTASSSRSFLVLSTASELMWLKFSQKWFCGIILCIALHVTSEFFKWQFCLMDYVTELSWIILINFISVQLSAHGRNK